MFVSVLEPSPAPSAPDALSIDLLEQRVLAAHASVGRAQQELCRAVAAHARSGAHRLDGARDEAEWLARRLALDLASARRLALVAERMEELPAMRAALAL